MEKMKWLTLSLVVATILFGCSEDSASPTSPSAQKEINGAYSNTLDGIRRQFTFFTGGSVTMTDAEVGQCTYLYCTGSFTAGSQVISLNMTCSERQTCSQSLSGSRSGSDVITYKWAGTCLDFTYSNGLQERYCP